MKKPFTETLRECIQALEAGADMQELLHRYPEQAAELRAHLQVWSSLSRTEKAEAGPAGFARGKSRLLAALAQRDAAQGGRSNVNTLPSPARFSLKLVGSLAIVAGIALGLTYFTGGMNEFGSGAQANHTHACLDQVVGNLADPPDAHFTGQDLLAARDAYLSQNTDPRYDRDGDGDVDIHDLRVYIQELKTCFRDAGFPIP